jgi:integrase/recombinase XerD
MRTTTPASTPRPRKSALRINKQESLATELLPRGLTDASLAPQRGNRQLSATDLRQLSISEFAASLREGVSKRKRPYQEHTITDYADAARALDRWMTAGNVDGDFTVCDTAMLNRFFAAYLKAHTQGGTNTLQRNLAHLFAFLDEVYDHPSPYTDRLDRYAPAKKRPATLDEEFIREMLMLTGDGRARDFENIRDHAIFRVFTEGPRRTEVAQMEIDDLSADLIARPFARVVPLKDARAYGEGRIIPFTVATGRALAAYVRARRSHRLAHLPALWLGTRGRGPLTGSGIYQMVKRRAGEAGYDPKEIWPHQWRDTFANDWLAGGGAEGDLMRLMGWTDRSMLDRYAEDLQVQRAIEAKRRRGNIY